MTLRHGTGYRETGFLEAGVQTTVGGSGLSFFTFMCQLMRVQLPVLAIKIGDVNLLGLGVEAVNVNINAVGI